MQDPNFKKFRLRRATLSLFSAEIRILKDTKFVSYTILASAACDVYLSLYKHTYIFDHVI